MSRPNEIYDVKLTPEQLESVEWNRGELLVGAAAGSGKTMVLVERFIHLVNSAGADPENLPTLTFTEKAAAQLRRRIRQRLEDMNARREILRGLDGAYISTIHSFCRRLLRENYHLAGIDPSFLVIAQEESRLMKQQALDEVFDDIFSGGDSIDDVRDLCNSHGGAGFDRGIKNQVLKLYEWLMRQVDPETTLDGVINESDSNPLESPGFKIFVEMVHDKFDRLVDGYRRMAEWSSDVKTDGTLTAYAKNIEQALLELDEIAAIDPNEELGKFLNRTSAWKRPSMRGKPPPELKELSDNLKADLFDRFNNLIPASADEGFKEMAESRRRLGILAELTKLFIDRYERLKERRWGLDFDDLQHRLMKVLRENPEVGSRYRERFKYLLIDEFQDNNRLQEAIIREVCTPGGLFMVGDSKQAIYRFRGAEPHVFMENERRLSEGSDGGLMRLDLNFRSIPDICDGVNALLGPLFTGDAAEIDYTDGHALVAARAASRTGNPLVEFNIIGRPESAASDSHDADTDDEADDREALEIEADWLAARIQALIESRETLIQSGTESRTVSYGDVVILLRSMKNRAAIFSNALKKLGIPHRQAGAGGFLDGQEIRDIRNLLRIIDNPLQDIPFASVLRSPLCGIDANGMYAIKQFAENADTLFKAAVAANDAAFRDGTTRNAISEFLKKLDSWRALEPGVSTAELILEIYNSTSYLDYVLGLNGGRVARANLQRLVDIARSAVPVEEGGLRKFIGFLDDIEAGDFDIEPGDVPDVEGAVTIMSIHSAKGLEFPVVAVPDLGKQFNDGDLRGEVIFDDCLGPAYRYVDRHGGYARPTFEYIARRERMRYRSRAEELRIYYVAFTRAREKLIVSGAVDLEKLHRLCDVESTGMNPYVRSPIEWFLPVLAGMDGFNELYSDEGRSAVVRGGYNSKWYVGFIPASVITKSRRPAAAKDSLREKIAAFEPLGLKEKQPLPEIEPVLARYAYEWATKLEDKLTAGRVRGGLPDASEEESFEFTPSRWDAEFEGASEDAMHAGILLHNAYEQLDLLGVNAPDWARNEAARIAAIVELPEGWDVKRLTESFTGLLNPPLGDILKHGDKILKERAFSVKLPIGELSSRINPEPQPKDWIMLQGRIDLVAIRGGKAWLVDYKSDTVPTGQFGEHARRYIPQMAAYNAALERISGLDVTCLLYFIRHGVIVDMTTEITGFDFNSAVLNACTNVTGDEREEHSW